MLFVPLVVVFGKQKLMRISLNPLNRKASFFYLFLCSIVFFSTAEATVPILNFSSDFSNPEIVVKNLPFQEVSIEIVFEIDGKRMSYSGIKKEGTTFTVPVEMKLSKELKKEHITIISVYTNIFNKPTKLNNTSLEIQVKA